MFNNPHDHSSALHRLEQRVKALEDASIASVVLAAITRLEHKLDDVLTQSRDIAAITQKLSASAATLTGAITEQKE